jgi:hypothetical protein
MSREHENLGWLRIGLTTSLCALFLSSAVACGDDATKPVGTDEAPGTAGDEPNGEVTTSDDDAPVAPPVVSAKSDAGVGKPTQALDASAKPPADGSSPSVSNDSGKTTANPAADAAAPPVVAAAGAHVVGPDPTKESSSGAAMGPFKTANFTMGYKDMPGFASGTIWYPTDEAAKPPYGCISVVPGFTAPESSIREWGPFLASHGIVTFTIMTNSAADQPDVRATALLDALESCKAENERTDSPLVGKIDKARLGVAGWSQAVRRLRSRPRCRLLLGAPRAVP